jgi:MinD superfamily P-loop ATPase
MKKQKSVAKLKQDVQKIFNEFIRLRDKDKPCISCGQNKELQAGHFFSVRMYDALRFDEDNCHGECAYCNCFDDNHLIFYHDNLLNKIGEERFNALYKRAENYKKYGYKWTRSELIELKEKYQQKIKEL